MVDKFSAGTRIRERRIELGIKQADLARLVGISGSYLNLIEHDHRRIGGKLVLELSHALGVEPSHFSENARVELTEALHQTITREDSDGALKQSVAAFVARHPEWAEFVLAQQKRLDEQTQLVAALTDRLAHDPHLAASVHEVLSVITSVRSTAGILANETELDRDWSARFHRNIYEDSQRLAESAQALVAYLEEAEDEVPDTTAPLAIEELETWFSRRNYHVPQLENTGMSLEEALEREPEFSRMPGLGELAERHLSRYMHDARDVPLEVLSPLAKMRPFPDPLAMANDIGCDFATLLRRIAALPPDVGPECGMAICDSSGTISFRRTIDGFPMPRFGAACPLWPLYQALSEPGRPLRSVIQHVGYDANTFVAFAVAKPKLSASYSGEQVFEATMLILPSRLFGPEADSGPARAIGTSCRVCARKQCPARREPPIGGYR